MRKTAFDLDFPSVDTRDYVGHESGVTALAPAVRVSAIIVTYHTGDALWECLNAVLADDSVSEALIVNNGNPADQEAKLNAFVAEHAKFKLVDGNGNVGFSKACNIGARCARGRYFLFLNPDAILDDGAVEAMIAAGEARPGLWLSGGMLLDAFGKEQRGARRGKLTLWNAAASFSGLSGLLSKLGAKSLSDVHWESQPLPAEPIVVPTVSGAFMMMPATHFRQIGGFDETYFLHVEDIDICRRVGDAGGQVVFAPGARAMHYGSTSCAHRVWVEWQKGKGLDIYFKKFASNRFEEACAFVMSPLIRGGLIARAFYLSVRYNRRTANIKRLRALANERRASQDAAPQFQDASVSAHA